MIDELSVGIVMPALNEEGVIGVTLNTIPTERVDVVWVADNGSDDRTVEEARAHGARVVREARRGYGSACQAALREMARAGHPDIVVFFDADGSEPIDELDKLLEPIARGHADLVIGVRRFVDAPLHVSAGNRLAVWILGALTGSQISDLGPFRAIRFDALQALELGDPDFGWNVEMQAKAVGAGLRIAQVPVSHRPRQAGRSKISGSLTGTVRAGSKILWTAVREGWRARAGTKRRADK
jgi:glycosyltransferase involved in cell wall biosynthesis